MVKRIPKRRLLISRSTVRTFSIDAVKFLSPKHLEDTTMMTHKKIYAILATVLLISPAAFSQTQTTGAVTGRITDSSGAVIAQATVLLTSKSSGVQSTIMTDQGGGYRFGLLPPGTYDMRVSAPGFKTAIPSSISVTVTETSAVNLVMAPGTQQETVQVSGGAELLQVTNATLGTTVQGRTIQALPLTERNYTQVLTMSPGVAGDVNNAAELGRGTIDVYVNGASNISNNFVMDGADINNFGSGRGGDFVQQGGIPIPNPDAIEEFKIQTTLYDAGFGRDAGANVEVVTKSGGNKFHGSAFEFFRNNKLNANDTFLNSQGQPRPDMKQNQFGGTIGGPVLRDRAFFFGSYQGTRQINGLSPSSLSSNTLPALTDDRSAAAIGSIFCGQPTEFGGTQVACDGSNINPVSLALLNLKGPSSGFLVPTPRTLNADGATGFSSYSLPGNFTEDQVLVNTDYQLSSKQRLSQRYFYSRDPQQDPFSSCSPGCPPGFALNTQFTNDIGLLKLTSTLSPNLLNEAFVAFIRNTGVLKSQTAITDASLGITPGDPGFPYLPVTIISGLFSLGGGFNDFSNSAVNTYEASDQASWSHGRHNFRFGYEFERQEFNFTDPGPRRGELVFLTFSDFLLGQSGTQNGSGISNVFLSYGIAGNINKDFRAIDMASFVQDDYKLSPNLTVNYGVRWEINGNIGEAHGDLSSVFPNLISNSPVASASGTYTGYVVPSNFPGTVPSGVVRLSGKSLTSTDLPLHNVGPRVGFAWQPFGSGRTAVRGGYGVYYTRPNGNATLQVLTSPPFVAIRELEGANNSAATFQNPYNPAPTPGAFLPRTPTSELGADIIASNYDSPMTQQYNLDLQQQITGSTVFDLAYVGTRATRLLESRNINSALLASPEAPINGETTNTQANAYLRVPYLGFSPSGLTRIESYGSSMYNSLQATLRRQLSHGVLLQAAYTWSKALTDVQGSGTSAVFTGGDGDSNDPNNRHDRWGPAAFDRTNRFVFVYRWELPSLHSGNAVARRVVNGWAVSGVTTIQDGDRLTITDAEGGSIYGFASTSRAQLAPGATNAEIESHGDVRNRLSNYFNTAAFCSFGSAPTSAAYGACPYPVIGDGTGYGNSSTGVVRGPSQDNSDITLSRAFPGLREGHSIDFRGEFFNAFNHAQYADPATGFDTAGFGVIGSSSVAPRIIQFALKYEF
jgi:hypothetical protein